MPFAPPWGDVFVVMFQDSSISISPRTERRPPKTSEIKALGSHIFGDFSALLPPRKYASFAIQHKDTSVTYYPCSPFGYLGRLPALSLS